MRKVLQGPSLPSLRMMLGKLHVGISVVFASAPSPFRARPSHHRFFPAKNVVLTIVGLHGSTRALRLLPQAQAVRAP